MLFSLKAINMINMPQDAPQTCDTLQPTDGHVHSKSTMKWQNVEAMMPLRMGLQVDYGLPLSPTQIVPDKNKELKISCRID